MRSSSEDTRPIRKLTFSEIEKKRKERELLLTKNFNELTDAEQLEYIKAYVFDFFKVAFSDYQARKMQGFTTEYDNTKTAIENAVDLTTIDAAISKFSFHLKNWEGAFFVESNSEDYFKEISRQLHQMTNLLYNLRFYSSYGIVVHSTAHQRNTEHTQYYTSLQNGLPPEVMKQILEDWRNISIMYVSGSGLNTYGHALLFLGKAGFLHIDTPYGYPKHMTINQFNTYLATEGKVLLGFQRVPLTKIKDVIIKLNELCKKRWLWLGVKHNCLTFCHDAVAIGGYNPGAQDEFKSLTLHLPTDWLFQTKQEQLLADITSHVIPITEFNEDLLKSHDILHIPVIDFNPPDIIKFIAYVIDNMDTIIRWQTDIVKNQPDKDIRQSDIEIAVSKIKFTLNDVVNKMRNQYKILFNHIVYSPIFIEMISKINPTINAAIARINIEDQRLQEVRAKLFASTKHPQSANISQDDEAKPRKPIK